MSVCCVRTCEKRGCSLEEKRTKQRDGTNARAQWSGLGLAVPSTTGPREYARPEHVITLADWPSISGSDPEGPPRAVWAVKEQERKQNREVSSS